MRQPDDKILRIVSSLVLLSVTGSAALAQEQSTGNSSKYTDSLSRTVHRARLLAQSMRAPAATATTNEAEVKATARGAVTNDSAGGTAEVGTSSGAPVPAGSASPSTLKGVLTLTERVDTPPSILSELLQAALQNDAEIQALDQRGNKYSTGSNRAVAKTKDMTNFVLAYKGFERSSEAADVILNEKLKVKSRASAAYMRQKLQDEHSSQIFSAVMQMAAAVGSDDETDRKESIEGAFQRLIPLVGEAKARETATRIQTWSETTGKEAEDLSAKPMSVLQSEKRIDDAVTAALKKDDVVSEIQQGLHKFNRRSNTMRVTAKIFNTACSIAMFTPNFISPAAQVAYLSFCLSTGGPEDAKLLKELYFDQRFHSRWKLYNHNAGLAVNNYNMALASKNKVLQRFCRSALSDMEAISPVATDEKTAPSPASKPPTSEPARKEVRKAETPIQM